MCIRNGPKSFLIAGFGGPHTPDLNLFENLLGCDEDEFQKKRSTNKEIAKVLDISMKKIDRVKKRFVEDGLDITLNGKKEVAYTLKKQTKTPIPVSQGQPAKYDYEYNPFGVRNIFVACEPLSGKRMVKITERKTKKNWSYILEELATQYENAEIITLVMDNLNTHIPGSFYETFKPNKTKALWNITFRMAKAKSL